MAKADQIKALIKSHFKNDGERFVTVALQLAAYEARQGHTSLARDIRRLIDDRKSEIVKVVSISHELDDLVQPIKLDTASNTFVVRQDITDKINRIVKEYHQYKKLAKYGLENRRKILLSGPPGTGKTMTAAVIAEKTKLPCFAIQTDRLITKYMGETAAKLRQIFSLIRERRGVYLFDEFDAIGTQRGLDNDVGEMRRVLNSLLQFIETDESNSLIIAATNNLSSLDSALFRRFDDILHYKLPSEEEAEKLIKNRLGTFIGNYSLSSILKKSKDLSHAEITQACSDAIKDAILADRKIVAQKKLLDMLEDRKKSNGQKA